jgi:hypothetical protein
MEYHLFKKEPASSWEGAKEKHIKSTALDENRINGKYEKAFPYNYDPEINFVYEGRITGPFTIQSDFTLYFLNDREQIEKGYKVLGTGEILEGDAINSILSPGEFYTWNDDTWTYDRQLEIESINSKIKTIETDLEDTRAKLDSREKLGMYIEDLKNRISELLQQHSEECQKLLPLVK